MSPNPIVEYLDGFEDGVFKLSSCWSTVPVEQFSLKRGVKAFGHCIIRRISDKAHRAQCAGLLHPIGEDDRGALRTVV